MHGKISPYDDKFVTGGYYNLNNISAFASVELNLDIMNDAFAKKAAASFQYIIDNDCEKVVKDEFANKNHLLLQFWQWICYQIIQVSFFIFTFYFRPQKD